VKKKGKPAHSRALYKGGKGRVRELFRLRQVGGEVQERAEKRGERKKESHHHTTAEVKKRGRKPPSLAILANKTRLKERRHRVKKKKKRSNSCSGKERKEEGKEGKFLRSHTVEGKRQSDTPKNKQGGGGEETLRLS